MKPYSLLFFFLFIIIFKNYVFMHFLKILLYTWKKTSFRTLCLTVIRVKYLLLVPCVILIIMCNGRFPFTASVVFKDLVP